MSTKLPTDLFTPTEGSTYLLDGYPDSNYGEGTARVWESATVRGLSGLPDGVVGGDSSWESKKSAINWEGFVLPEELDADEHVDLVDHSWLDADPEDEVLPKSPHVTIPQLEEAWGVHRRTNGVHLVPVQDKERVAYEASVQAGPIKTTVTKGQVSDVVARAWRQVTAGVPLKRVGAEIASALGDNAHRAKAAFDAMREEVGLVGKVYIRAEAYPKCASGAWNDAVRKTACDAQYVQAKPQCTGCVMAQQGRCAVFGGRQIVPSVPYREALEVYAPRLVAAGVRVASGDPKEALRRGLRAAAVHKASVPETNFYVLPDVAAGVSRKDARQALAAATGPAAVRSPKEVQLEKDLTKSRLRVARYVRDGLLDRAEAAHLVVSVTDPAEMLQRAAAIAARPVNASEYSGAENDLVAQAANRGLSATKTPKFEHTPEEVRYARELNAAQIRVGRYVRNGLVSERQAAQLIQAVKDPAELLRRVASVASAPLPASAYTGSENDLVNQIMQRGLSATKTPVFNRDDARRRVHAAIARWHRDGLLTRDAARSLVASSADPSDVAKAAAGLIAAAGQPLPSDVVNLGVDTRTASVFIGPDNKSRKVTAQDIWRELKVAETRAASQQAELDAVAVAREQATTRAARRTAAIAGKVAAVVAEIERGVRGSALAGFIHRTIAPNEVREASVALDPVLRRTAALADGPSKTPTFKGPKYQAAPQFTRTASGPAYGEVNRLARWARRLMAEGVAGSELDHRINARFASSVRTAGTDTLAALRREHEGLSGHVYVDAAAYVTKTGTAGCEEGARYHRANYVPAVLEMPDKCGTCVQRTARKDGTSACSLYGKPLVKSATEVVANPAKHQREMIRLADAPDQEVTASLFANTYDPTEFALGQDTELDQVEVSDMPDTADMGQYFFGGIQLD